MEDYTELTLRCARMLLATSSLNASATGGPKDGGSMEMSSTR